jgi:hypothetical protein
MSPDTARQDDVTFQVPTTEPPHAATSEQLGTPPPLPVDPPVAVEPPAPGEPPVPLDWTFELLQPSQAIAAARATKQNNVVLIRIGALRPNCQKPAAFVQVLYEPLCPGDLRVSRPLSGGRGDKIAPSQARTSRRP